MRPDRIRNTTTTAGGDAGSDITHTPGTHWYRRGRDRDHGQGAEETGARPPGISPPRDARPQAYSEA
jgi:hypothetical protein